MRLTRAERIEIGEIARYVGSRCGREKWEVDQLLSEAQYLEKIGQNERHLPMPACKRIVAVQAIISESSARGLSAYRLWKRELEAARKRWE